MKPNLRRLLPTLLPALAVTSALLRTSLPAAAAVTVTPVPVTDGFVDQVLAVTGGVGVYADDSSVTNCSGSGGKVVYRTDYVLMRSNLGDGQIAAAVGAALTAIGVVGGSGTVTGRVSVPGIASGPIVQVGLTGVPANRIVALTRRLVLDGYSAAPSYYFQPHGGPTYTWPAGRPDPIPALPAPRASAIGTGTTAIVFDTGVPSATEANLPANMSKIDLVGDVEVIDATKDGLVDHHDSGHATAISGVLRLLAPGAKVQVARISGTDGVITDLTAARRMASVLTAADAANAWPTAIVAAFGAPACDVDPAVPGRQLQSMGLQAVAEAVAAKGKSVFFASAGNVDRTYPFYPAAFPGVVSVGALDTTADGDGNAYTAPSRSGPKASFSNSGATVDLWAPGVQLPTYHAKGGVRFGSDGLPLDGRGAVDGTSYAAPVAAAMLLDTVWRTGRAPLDALALLTASGVPCSAAIGGGRAIALTSWSAGPLDPPRKGTTPLC